MSQEMWHPKEPSLLNAYECRAQVIIIIPSPLMVTSPYEWKILEWDDKPQTNNVKVKYSYFTIIQTLYCTIKLSFIMGKKLSMTQESYGILICWGKKYRKLWNFVLQEKKTMVLYRKQCDFLINYNCETLNYHVENYGTIILITMELWFTMENTLIPYQNLWY